MIRTFECKFCRADVEPGSIGSLRIAVRLCVAGFTDGFVMAVFRSDNAGD
jgi:hypothetical protein